MFRSFKRFAYFVALVFIVMVRTYARGTVVTVGSIVWACVPR
jgi:hypothetical protein